MKTFRFFISSLYRHIYENQRVLQTTDSKMQKIQNILGIVHKSRDGGGENFFKSFLYVMA